MESIPLKEARDQLGRIHSSVAHGHRHVRVTRHGSDAVVLVPQEDYAEYLRLKQAEIARHMAESLDYLRRGETPPGAEKVSKHELQDGSWLA